MEWRKLKTKVSNLDIWQKGQAFVEVTEQHESFEGEARDTEAYWDFFTNHFHKKNEPQHKTFSSKKEAIAYAREYMRKHKGCV